MKVAILPGMMEGSLTARKLSNVLEAEGYEVIKNATEADVIIAHSGGIHFIPEHNKACIVLAVGIPYWPGQKMIKSVRLSLKKEQELELSKKFLLRARALNALYFITHGAHHARMYSKYKSHEYPDAQKGQEFLIIRNRDDTYANFDFLLEAAKKHGWVSLSLPGHHDDIWLHPKRYIECIKSVADNVHFDTKA